MEITIDDINRLASKSFELQPTGDKLADELQEWTADEKNRGAQMWWGKKQPYYVFLYELAKFFHGGIGVEVGTAHGVGFAHLAAGANASGDNKSWTVGIDKDSHHVVQQIEKNYRNTAFLHGLSNSPGVISKIEAICSDFDVRIKILFIDATHTIWWVKEEIYQLKRFFADQLVVVMDDVIKADNNTLLPQCFSELPGVKKLFPEMHTDNCIGVSIAKSTDFDSWNSQPAEKLTV